ncbi:MAG: aldo/keto reductase [Candidatus Latescibacterota bacterium]|jgi:aryl-alcohol dehydrogenase-like predicted oxidoreductase
MPSMHYATMGKTGLKVSRVSVGTDIQLVPDRFLPILRRAGELGVSFVDTDYSYSYPRPDGSSGQSWEAVREWLREVDREQVVLAAKTYDPTPDGAFRHAEESLAGLGTEYVDVFLLHGLNTLEDWERFRPALEGCLRAKEQGLVRHVGLSTHTVTLAREAARHPELEVLLVTLNATGKVMKRSGSPEEMQAAMQVLCEQGRGVYIMKSLARGRVFWDRDEEAGAGAPNQLTREEIDRALSYVFRCPWAHAVTIGMRSIAELEENAAVAARVDAELGRWEVNPRTAAAG